MSKIGINLKIDVTKIDKNKLFQGKTGAKYLDMTCFVNLSEADQYGNHGMITQAKKKYQEENGNILGNAKIFWTETGTQSNNSQTNNTTPKDYKQQPQFNENNFDDEIPF